MDELKGTSIKLVAADKEFVRRLGHGNISEGVRILIVASSRPQAHPRAASGRGRQ